jgi:hypothetical protein
MHSAPTSKRYETFRDFYPFYLSEHGDRMNRRLHFFGTSISLGLIIAALALGKPWLLLAAAVAGYAFAWVGHFLFEKNRPATFKYPFFSLAGDWVMWKDIITGRIHF